MYFSKQSSYKDFLANSGSKENITEPLVTCLKTKGVFCLEIKNDGVLFRVEKDNSSSPTLSFEGQWRGNPISCPEISTAAGKLLLPLMLTTSRIRLPYQFIYYTGAEYHSAATTLMRNIFITLCQNAPIKIATTPLNRSQKQYASDFQRRYLWILKSTLKDPIWESQYALEHLTANTFLEVSHFSNPLLRSGLRHLREINCKESAIDQLGKRLEATRTNLLKQIEN
ncbi:hypothetical protein [Neptunicoccus sediminis]|uniref:hypothetical protein n=1 Tax=Neptunicoccus sediminis TaxID=1892596 RepID=UPI0008461C34|nr:hypothetical protein [Neptunicoccus sediminis]